MKSVLISIQPKWCELIASGKKTIEVRKTKPKLETPFKVYIYCTQDKKFNFCTDNGEQYTYIGNGKVIGEFVCDEIIEILPDNEIYGIYDISDDEVIASCLVNGDLWDYGKGKTLYGWHISNLVIYDKPRKLGEFRKPIECHRGKDRENCVGCWDCEITHPPQSWCYVESEVSE